MSIITEFDKILQLPDIKLSDEVQKVSVTENPDLSYLTKDQIKIFDEVINMVNSAGSSFYLIKGYAGTGKTFLTTIITEYILHNSFNRVALTAPTNKAVKVLRRYSKFDDTKIDKISFNTIHSLLGLKETIVGNKQVFKRLRADDVKITKFQVVIIDEVSMLDDFLFEDVYNFMKEKDLKVILVGDGAQIPPVNKDNCIPFTDKGIDKYKITVGELTKVLRQAQDNPIIKSTIEIRNRIFDHIVFPLRLNDYDVNTADGIYHISYNEWSDIYNLMNIYFNSENFKKNPDFIKVLAWTNSVVDEVNNTIREMIYGENIPMICKGEKLIADKPIIDEYDDKVILYTTNDEFEVLDYEIKEKKIGRDLVKYYHTKTINGSKIKDIKICHEESLGLFKSILDDIAKDANSYQRGSSNYINLWKKFYQTKTIFAEIKYNYAITCHKAQGSSYDNAIILENDIDKNRNIIERNRIKYTACTRPRHKLFIVK